MTVPPPADAVAQLPDWAWPTTPTTDRTLPPATLADPFSWRPADVPDGVFRLAVKENVAVAGRPLRAGSPARDREPPQPRTAPAVARLLDAGAVLVGTTRMHELAFGVTGRNDADGTVPNPVDPARLPGGSSSGSAAAVALGLADAAVATDTGGSARIPAALCGVVGVKASRAVPPTGVLPLAPTLDHLGWCTRDVRTAAEVAAYLGLDPAPPPAEPRLAVLRCAADEASPAVASAFAAALEALAAQGFSAYDADWPHLDLTAAVSTTIMYAEAARWHGDRADAYGPDVAARLARGASVGGEAYRAALALRLWLHGTYLRVLAGAHAVVTPTCGVVAPPLTADPSVAATLIRVTRLDDLTGLPALSLPIPGQPLPVGLHLTARTEGDLLALAARAETALGMIGS